MRSKKAFYNILSSLILQGVILISGFIVPKLIIKNYGSDVNGLISSITQFLSYIALLESGVGPVVKAALYKPIAEKDNKKIRDILKSSEKFFRIISIIFIIYLVGLSLIYPFIVKKEFGYFFTLSLVLIISISTFFEYYFGMTYKLYLQANQQVYVTSIIQIGTYIFNIIFIVLLIKINVNIHVVKLVSGFIFALRPIIQNIYVKKKYNINLKDADKNYNLEKKWDGLAQHIAAIIHSNTDITILTFMGRISEISVYSVYALVTKGIKSIVQAFSDGIDSTFGDMIARNEKSNLNEKFHIYELAYFTIVTILYSSTLLLISPFIKVYTFGIKDEIYVRQVFGYLIVISEFIWSIRQPYNNLVKSAGHFKETRVGAWVEAIINIIISILLVNKFGLAGIALGTLVAMLIRTVEFIYHSNKYILGRNVLETLKKIIVLIIDVIVIVLFSNLILKYNVNSYFSWFIYAFFELLLSSFITIFINYLVFQKDFKKLFNILKNLILNKFRKKKV